MDDLPMEVLRMIVEPLGLRDRYNLSICNHFLEKAVATSKLTSIEDGKLVVTLHSDQTWHVSFLDVIISKSISNFIFCVGRLFSEAAVTELKMNNVTFKEPELREFDDFVEERCTFDRFTITISSFTTDFERLKELMRRVRKDVTIAMTGMYLSPEKLLSFDRIVTFQVDQSMKFTGAGAAFLREDLFLELVRRGNSILKFTTKFTSMNNLEEVIEKVSSSRYNQIVGAKVLSNDPFNDICARYVRRVGATTVQMPGLNAVNSPLVTRAYRHLGTLIYVTKDKLGMVREARIIVKSVAYDE